MKTKKVGYLWFLGLLLLVLPACQGGGGYSSPGVQEAAAPAAPPAISGSPVGTGRQYNAGQMYGMMGGGMMGGQGCQGPSSLQGPQQQYRGRSDGASLFAANCASCHPNGGNRFNPNMPVRGAPQLSSFYGFEQYVREGHRGMPPFSPERISASQMRALYNYVISAWGS